MIDATEVEFLREDDPDYQLIKKYKAAHGIERDLNDCDVVVLMRRARFLLVPCPACNFGADEDGSEY